MTRFGLPSEWAYPPARGGNRINIVDVMREGGLSPRTQGEPRLPVSGKGDDGSIPAYARSAMVALPEMAVRSLSPRMRGERKPDQNSA